MSELGQYLRQQREARGWSRTAVLWRALRRGHAREALRPIEDGAVLPEDFELAHLAHVYDVPLAEVERRWCRDHGLRLEWAQPLDTVVVPMPPLSVQAVRVVVEDME